MKKFEVQPRELKSRFNIVIKTLGGLNAAAEIASTGPQQVARWRDGKAKPPLFGVAALASAAGVTLDWLMFGIESAHANVQATPNLDAVLIDQLNVHASAGSGHENNETNNTRQIAVNKDFLRMLVGHLDASKLNFITVKGDSMEPTISNGDIALIDISAKDKQDDIYAFWDKDAGARIKRLQWTRDGVHVISDNKDYEKEFIPRHDFEIGDVGIAGRLVWAGKRFF